MTCQNDQNNVIYILISKSCMFKQFWILCITEELVEPLFYDGVNSNAIMADAFELHLRCYSFF
jgi:hypothetical protein